MTSPIEPLKKRIEEIKELGVELRKSKLTKAQRRDLQEALDDAEKALSEIKQGVASEDDQASTEQQQAEERLKQRLLKEGLISDIKPLHGLPEDDWIPIKAKGKPLSEIIIEERR